MEKVLTITLNPAIDKSTTISALLPAKKLRCTSPEFHPGGGGINVSSVLAKFGYASTAMFLAGGFTGSFFEKLVQQHGIETCPKRQKLLSSGNCLMLQTSSKT